MNRSQTRRFAKATGATLVEGLSEFPFWVMPDGSIRPHIAGGAAATQDAAVAAGPVVPPFLHYARPQPLPVQLGTLAAGGSGGTANDVLTWNPNNVQAVPGWCDFVTLHLSIPVAVVVAAGKTATMSPLAPYSAMSVGMSLSGAPEWPNNTSLVPFWLDEITNHNNAYDPYKTGSALATTNQLPGDIAGQYDGGAAGPTFAAGADTVLPGGTIAGGGGGVTKHITVRVSVRIQLQRVHSQMWGMIPLGDPQNQAVLRAQLNALVGTNPENNMFLQDASGTGVTATVDTGGVTCALIWHTRQIDALPQTVTNLPAPRVGLGLNVTYDNSWTFANAGVIQTQAQKTAQLYTQIHHLLVSAGAMVRPDYIGLWLTGNAQSARWAYDASVGNFQSYFSELQRVYGRFLPKGHVIADLARGWFPDIPREDPYMGLMSPDAGYAAAAGVAVTPNMATALRFPTGTTMTNAYVASYTFGLVTVPY